MFFEVQQRNNNVNFVEYDDEKKEIPLVSFLPETPFPYKQNYGAYVELTEKGYQQIFTKDITVSNWSDHLNSILNIMKDGIELDFLHQAKLNVVFTDNVSINLSIFDYYFNIMLWILTLSVGDTITSENLFFEENITKNSIKKYIDDKFINKYILKLNDLPNTTPELVNIMLNNIIDKALYEFSNIDHFSFYLANTINLEDNITLMRQYPEFNQLMHADLSGVPIEDVKNVGMDLTKRAIFYIKNSDHCLADSFRAGEGVNPKQYREFSINIGSKPDGMGGIFPAIINKSFINGGVSDVTSLFIESHGGRTAQIIAKCNVGTSGHFARLLGLNNRDSVLHINPKYDCGSRNYEEVFMKNDSFLRMFEGRFYRYSPNGMEYKLNLKDYQVIGKTLYFRSPMTCASHSRGRGICYKCYGNLAYTNSSINIGQLASELLSAALTQRLLSAKHLLEAMVQALEWSKEFANLFEVEFNIIRLIDNVDYKGYKLLIDPNNISMESEEDDYEYNEYVTMFEVKTPTGKIIPIYTKESDPIYISTELNEIIRDKAEASDDKIELNMEALTDSNLFLIYITNNELSKTLEMVKSIINKDSITSSFDRNGILQKFVETVMEGGLNTIAVHLEVILSNQLRDPDNILLKPNWDNLNEPYKLITLNRALTDNPSVTVSMQYQKLAKVFFNPLTFRKNKPSFVDLLFMEKPQMYMLNKNLIDTKWKPLSDKDEVQDLVIFETDDNK